MSKVTKNELKKQLDGVQNRFAALVKDLKASGHICESVYAPFAHDYQKEQSDHDAAIVILDSKNPQLKQLDQSVIDGLDENWQNSLIERDDIAKELLEVDLSSELTGSDLTAQIMDSQKYQAAFVSDESEDDALKHKRTALIDNVYTNGINERFRAGLTGWIYAIPINNQGEPLTQAEVGL